MTKIKPNFKLWLETEEGSVFGEGAFVILERVKETGSLSAAAKSLHMSYRHAWGLIKQIERGFGHPVLRSYKGGRSGGGGSKLTKKGVFLMNKYQRSKDAFSKLCENGSLNLELIEEK